MNEVEILSTIKKTGVAEADAIVIADCVVTRKSCSWVNTDPVKPEAVRNLLNAIKENDFKINVSIKTVSTRDKFIWEIKALP